MTTEQLKEQVRKVRKLQKEYFKNRSPYVLDSCKREEKILDQMVEENHTEQKQGNLFN